MVSVGVVWAVPREQALGCCRFFTGDGENLVCLLAKSLAGSRLGKAAAAKWDFVPKPLGFRLGSGITPGLLLGLISYFICVMFPVADGVSSGLIKDHNCDLVTSLALLLLELSELSGCLRELLTLACSCCWLRMSVWTS